MKKRLSYILYTLLLPLVFVSCAEESEVQPEQDVDFCVRAAWQDGLSKSTTRALSTTDILTDAPGDIVINTADYPATINVHCSDGTDFTLTKGTALCTDHSDYWQYTASTIYKDKKIERDNLTFTFSATIDGDDVLTGTADKDAISDKTSANQRHMLVTLHHTKALLRFAFKVSEKYDKVRFIRVTGIQLNDSPCELVDKVLTTDGQFIAYCYIDPKEVTTSTENTIRCTYNIYDKDEATDAHLTRKDVVAQNTFTLNKVFSGFPAVKVTEIKAGYYYDLKVTLNPDYLYVMSEHDNKHITIN